MTRKTILVYVAITIATLLSAEALARIYDWTPTKQDASLGDGLGDLRYEHSYSGSGDLLPNQDGHWMVWFHRPYHVQTNSTGLRNTEEPIPTAYKVLALGDSQTFGPILPTRTHGRLGPRTRSAAASLIRTPCRSSMPEYPATRSSTNSAT